MITKEIEAKTIVKHISCDCKLKFNNKTYSSNKKWNNETCQCECKNVCKCKNDYSWNTSIFICEKSKCLKRFQ